MIEWLVKLLFIIMLAPFFIGLFVQLVVGTFLAALPWLAVLVAIPPLVRVAGRALLDRRNLSAPRPGGAFPSGTIPRVKRPRGRDER